MTSYTKTFPVSWHEIHRDAKALAWRLESQGPWEGIIAITRGGMVPAAIVARELDLRVIDTISVSSYDHQSLGEGKILKSISPELMNDKNKLDRWLIIDDLVDTGSTARLVKKILPAAHLAAVYAKPLGCPFVDSFVTEVSQDTWIMFPWDTEMQFSPPIAERKK